MKRRWVLFFFFFSAICDPAFAKLSPNTELSLYRFYPSYDANSAAVASYKLENGLFAPKQMGRLNLKVPGSDDCQVLLNQLQSFPLQFFKQIEYLTDDDFYKQVAVIKELVPEQVSYLEMTIPVPSLVVRANPVMYPSHVISPRPDEARPGSTHIRQATMWVISGQSMYPFSYEDHRLQFPKSRPVPLVFRTATRHAPLTETAHSDAHTLIMNLTALPWQMDDSLWKSGKLKQSETGFAELSREKYPIVYEFGRAAQVEPEHMEAMFRAALTIVEDDLATSLQAEPEQTFIFVKAFDHARFRRFRRVGFRPVEGLCDQHSCLMVAPFLELTKRYPPGSHSRRVQLVLEAFKNNPHITHGDALNFLRRIQAYFRAELDFVVKPFGLIQKSALVVHDLSPNYHTLLRAWLEGFAGNSQEQASKWIQMFSQFRHDNSTNNYLNDVIPVHHFMNTLTDLNAIRITNLDPELNQNPNYLPLVLTGVYQYLQSRYEELSVTNGAEVLEKAHTTFVLQTTHGSIAQRATEMGGKAFSPMVGEDHRILYTVQFTLEQVRALTKQNPAWAKASQEGVAQGRWFFRGLTGSPLKF